MVIKVVLIKFYSDESSESANDDDLGLSLDKHNLGKKKKKRSFWDIHDTQNFVWESCFPYILFSV